MGKGLDKTGGKWYNGHVVRKQIRVRKHILYKWAISLAKYEYRGGK